MAKFQPKFTQEQIDKKLREIQNSIPPELLEMEEKLKTPVMKFLSDKVVESPDTKPEVREQVQRLQRLGIFDQTNKDFSLEQRKKIMDWLEQQIKLAIKRGELPHPDQSPFMRKLHKLRH